MYCRGLAAKMPSHIAMSARPPAIISRIPDPSLSVSAVC